MPLRFRLKLMPEKMPVIIPVNYQYPLSAAFYKILERADKEYSKFLHDQGYGKGFKMFVFSDIKCPFLIRGDRLVLKSRAIEVIICFHLPVAAEAFIRGLFLYQKIEIADKKSRGTFAVAAVESLPSGLEGFKPEEDCEVLIRPLSPIVCGYKKENGYYDYLSPEDPAFSELIYKNWEEKCKAVLDETAVHEIMQTSFVKPEFYKNPPKSRLVTIKSGTAAKTMIRGFNNFSILLRGRKEAISLLCNAGVGIYNAQGMGCVEVRE